MTNFDNTYDALLAEYNSGISPEQQRISQRENREALLKHISKLRDDRMVVSVFLSFEGSDPLSDAEADLIEEILINSDCSKGVSLLIDAPGGDPLASERIIQVFRNYSNENFEVIVPCRAKSAATMICLGANQILMGPAAELGPIDPQYYRRYKNKDIGSWMPAHHIVDSYFKLFNGAIAEEGDGKAPYLQKLDDYDPVEIESHKSANELSKSIAISSLVQGMMRGTDIDEIVERIRVFTDPELTLSHGRRIGSDLATHCGLNILAIERESELWKAIWSLYLRSKWLVDRDPTCGRSIIETMDNNKFYIK